MPKKCMHVKSIIEGLHHPSFEIPSICKNIWFPAVAYCAVRISNQNNSANSKQNSKKMQQSKQGANGVDCWTKPETNILCYCPFKAYSLLFFTVFVSLCHVHIHIHFCFFGLVSGLLHTVEALTVHIINLYKKCYYSFVLLYQQSFQNCTTELLIYTGSGNFYGALSRCFFYYLTDLGNRLLDPGITGS